MNSQALSIVDGESLDRQLAHRRRLSDRAHCVLGADAVSVLEYGSTSGQPRRDLYSDVDLWVVVPDGAEEEVIASRDLAFRAIGGAYLRYERPRFAPLDGMHSIVMYPGPVVSQELDITILPERHHGLYEDFLTAQANDPSDAYPWREGDDSKEPADKLAYLLCVAYWTMKYVLRGEEGRLSWLLKRYAEVRQFVPELPALEESWADEAKLVQTVTQVVGNVEGVAEKLFSTSSKESFSRFRAVPSLGVSALDFATRSIGA